LIFYVLHICVLAPSKIAAYSAVIVIKIGRDKVMVMRLMRSGTNGGFFKYILFALLGMSVGGLVVMDVRGVLSGGSVGSSDVAVIENDTISIQDFDRTLQRSLAKYRGISPQQAYKIGLTEEILTGEIRTYYLLNEARSLGINFDKTRIAQQVAELIKPNARPGQSLQETLDMMLRYQKMSESAFVEAVKRESSGNLIMQALRSGFRPDNSLLANDLYQTQNQTRDIELLLFPDSSIKNIEQPTEEQLRQLYNSVKDLKFTLPEYRTTKMMVFDPDKIKVNVSTNEDEAKSYYEKNIDNYRIGEQLIISQALLDDEKQAQEVYDLTLAGKSLKEATKQVLGSETKYFAKRNFETSAMLPSLLDAVKAIDIGGITKPTKTILGYHVVLLDEVVPPSIRTFDEVKNTVINEVNNSKRDEEIYKISQEVDESLDKGTPLNNIADKYNLEISNISPSDNKGLGVNNERILQNIDGQDQKIVLEIIFDLIKGETSLLQELPSGQIAAFSISDIKPEHIKPFDEVKDELSKQYLADQKHADNEMKVKKLLAEIGTGGSNFESISKEQNVEIQKIKNIPLSGEVPAPLTNEQRPSIFETYVGEYKMLELDGSFALLKVVSSNIPEINKEAGKEIAKIRKTLDREAGDEMFLMYIRSLSDKYPAKINNRLLENVYGQKIDEE